MHVAWHRDSCWRARCLSVQVLQGVVSSFPVSLEVLSRSGAVMSESKVILMWCFTSINTILMVLFLLPSNEWMEMYVWCIKTSIQNLVCSQHQINTVHTFRLSQTITTKEICANKVLNEKKVQLYIVVKCRNIYRGVCVCVCVCVCYSSIKVLLLCVCVPDIFPHGGGKCVPGIRGSGVFIELLAASRGHDAEHELPGQNLFPGPALQPGCPHPPLKDEAWRESGNAGSVCKHQHQSWS